MIIVVATVVVIGALIGVLAVFLFIIGALLSRIAANLGDCLRSVKKIKEQAEVVIPGVERINLTGGVVAGALPLLVEAAEGVATKLTSPKPSSPNNARPSVPAGVGYLDL